VLVGGSNLYVDRERLAREGVYDDDVYGDAAPFGSGSDTALALVDFAVRPHLDSPDFPEATPGRLARLAESPTYAIDDHSAVAVDDVVRVISAGNWQYLPGS
jgi:hypothetical protein